ncbi:Unknown protein [Striga hermonthica]|uniref:Uncharacterized protein n=1 Tax=Striga hermonthica TaxID=68872 RepID=A0A9N7RJK8_STRHE|nr:Unknown protein [Striga hermonthica]
MRCDPKSVKMLAILALIFLSSVETNRAARIPNGEQVWTSEKMGREDLLLILSSLQRGRPVGRPSPNGCTWVPGQGGKPCATTVGQRNFAGKTRPAAGNN